MQALADIGSLYFKVRKDQFKTAYILFNVQYLAYQSKSKLIHDSFKLIIIAIRFILACHSFH